MGDRSTSERAVRLLRQVATALSAGGAIDGLPQAASRVAEWCLARRAAVAVVSDIGSSILHLVAASDEPGLLRLPFSRAAYPVIDRALAERMVLCDEGAEPSSVSSELFSDGRLLVVPILAEGEASGCLMVRLPSEVTLEDGELDVLLTVCQLLGLALRGGQVLATLRDQTRKIAIVGAGRHADEAARRAVDGYRDYFDASTEAMLVVDGAGEVIHASRAFEQLSGYAVSGLDGRSVLSLVPPAHHGALGEVIAGCIADQQREGFDFELITTSGEVLRVSASTSAVLVEHQLAVLSLRDVTEARALEGRLADAQQKLAESEKQAIIAELAGATAHELNQPLTAIVGYTELLLKHLPEDDPSRRALTIVLREADRMAEIVRQIGTITRYESKPYVGTTSIVDFEKSARQA